MAEDGEDLGGVRRTFVGDLRRQCFERPDVIFGPRDFDVVVDGEGTATMRTRRVGKVGSGQARMADELGTLRTEARVDGVVLADDTLKAIRRVSSLREDGTLGEIWIYAARSKIATKI